MSSFGKIVGSILLAVLGAIGLLMSLCGGVFTLGGLQEHNEYGILLISVPSLVIGSLLGWIGFRGLLRRIAKPPQS